MAILQQFDTPIRRLCLIGMVVGLLVLATSLAVWNDNHRWFYWSSWFRGHTFFAVVGITLTVGGFFGSFAPRFVAALYRGTIGRMLYWVRTGETSKPSSDDDRAGSDGNVTGAHRSPRMGIDWWFLPHLIIVGVPVAVVGLGAAANDASIGALTGRTLASLIDPLNLIVAVPIGLLVKRHPVLIGVLTLWGLALAIIVRQLNFATGGMPHPDSVLAKMIAALMVGYATNYFVTLFRRQQKGAAEN